MPGRHRSSRSRPIADRPASIAADSAVVDADSSRTERRERRGRGSYVGMWQIAGAGSFRMGAFLFLFSPGGFGGGEAPRKRGGARKGRTSRGRREEGGSLGTAEGGGPQDEVEGRRRVICDSKRAIHLATCQHSIVGICLWNQSRRTHPLLDLVPPLPPPWKLAKCFEEKRENVYETVIKRFDSNLNHWN